MKKLLALVALLPLVGCSVGGIQLTKETATCEIDGQKFAVGESFDEDCNSCTCLSSGEIECTEIDCDAVELANPAAIKCVEDGFEYEIRKNNDGSEFGVCLDAEGDECLAWEYFRGECVFGIIEEDEEKDDQREIIANPAAVKCVDDGFEYEIRNTETGGQVGFCTDGVRECDSQSYSRGECRLGEEQEVARDKLEQEVVESEDSVDDSSESSNEETTTEI